MVRFALVFVALGCTATRPSKVADLQLGEAEDTQADKSLLEGIVADALYEVKVQKALQLEQQRQSLADTNEDLADLRSKLSQKEHHKSKHDDWWEFSFCWPGWLKQITKEINDLKLTRIPNAEGLKADQMTTIATLEASIERFGAASSSAESFETSIDEQKKLIEDLTSQLATLNSIRQKMVTDNIEEVERREKVDKVKLQKKQFAIGSITALLNANLSEHTLLTETHNHKYCKEKREKNERICETCSDGQVPCGDDCIADGKSCHYDVGCACSESSPGALLQIASTGPEETHADVKRIADAKAVIRRAIEEHGNIIHNYTAFIATTEQEKHEVELQKEKAIKTYDTAINALQKSIERNTENKASEEKAKEESQAELDKVTSEGKAGLQKLAALVRVNIQKLRTSRSDAEATYALQLKANQDSMEVLLDSHAEALNQRDKELASLQQQKQSARTQLADWEAKLANLKAEHQH